MEASRFLHIDTCDGVNVRNGRESLVAPRSARHPPDAEEVVGSIPQCPPGDPLAIGGLLAI